MPSTWKKNAHLTNPMTLVMIEGTNFNNAINNFWHNHFSHSVCRPVRDQRSWYCGHHHTHCFKWWVISPNDLVASVKSWEPSGFLEAKLDFLKSLYLWHLKKLSGSLSPKLRSGIGRPYCDHHGFSWNPFTSANSSRILRFGIRWDFDNLNQS